MPARSTSKMLCSQDGLAVRRVCRAHSYPAASLSHRFAQLPTDALIHLIVWRRLRCPIPVGYPIWLAVSTLARASQSFHNAGPRAAAMGGAPDCPRSSCRVPAATTEDTTFWWPSPVKAGACAPRAIPGVWCRRRPTLATTSFPAYLCAIGCCLPPSGCVTSCSAIARCWAWCYASSCE